VMSEGRPGNTKYILQLLCQYMKFPWNETRLIQGLYIR